MAANTVGERPRRLQDDDDDDDDILTFVVDQDFLRQLMDKFGWDAVNPLGDASTIMKIPASLAKQIHYFILRSQEQERRDADEEDRRTCQEDERIARQIYNEMNQARLAEGTLLLDGSTHLGPAVPEDVDLQRLERQFPQVDKELVHFIYSSKNRSIKESADTLAELLDDDQSYFSESVRGEREQRLLQEALATSIRDLHLTQQNDAAPSAPSAPNSSSDDIRSGWDAWNGSSLENPWEAVDPNAAYNDHREKADSFFKARADYYRKASEAFSAGRAAEAGYYSVQGRECDQKWHEHQCLASASLIAAHANDHCRDTLDLHFFKVDEAVTVLDIFLDYQIRNKDAKDQALTVITGKGIHSPDGKSRIKPAVITRLQQRQLRFEAIRGNAGALRVFVREDSPLAYQVEPWIRNKRS